MTQSVRIFLLGLVSILLFLGIGLIVVGLALGGRPLYLLEGIAVIGLGISGVFFVRAYLRRASQVWIFAGLLAMFGIAFVALNVANALYTSH